VALAGSVACRERPRAGSVTSSGQGPAAAGTSSPGAPHLEERPQSRDPLALVEPPEHENQRLAFSRDRLAWLHGGEVRVFELPALALATVFQAPDARNLVALTGGGFLVAARDHVQRLSNGERRPELLPRAPRIGPTTIFPSRQEAEQFWLYYEGVAKLPLFDLGAPPGVVSSLSVQSWTLLPEFDRRALLGAGDGSFVYTTPEGLRRIDVEGHTEVLPQPELAGRVWSLAADARLDRVWATTTQHLYLVHVRERAELLERHELAAHPVALASDAGQVVVLAVEAWSTSSVRLRADVYERGVKKPRTVPLLAALPSTSDAGEHGFRPEVAVSASGGLLAIDAFGLQIHDYRRGVRLYPPVESAQKLAPSAP